MVNGLMLPGMVNFKSIESTFGGHALSPSERINTKNSLHEILMNEPNFKEVCFWGKISGMDHDYIVVKALQSTHEISNKFFASNDEALSFFELPSTESWVAERCARLVARFAGDTAFIYKEKKAGDGEGSDAEDEPEEEEDAGEAKPDAPPPQILTELQRLSYTVRAISDQCSVVPLGAFRLTSGRDIVKDKEFKGLDSAAVGVLSSFVHFRPARGKRTLQTLRGKSVIIGAKFLDPLSEDIPNGVWTMRTDDPRLTVTLRNHAWPGYEFRHQLRTPNYVSAYFGTGVPNTDLVFMV
eukprot:195884_1